MIREGQADVTLRYIAESPKRLAISNFTDGACVSGMSTSWASGEVDQPENLRSMVVWDDS